MMNLPTPSTTRSAIYQVAALQFMTFAARGFSWPFVNLYLVSVGFTGSQIGLLASISALVQLSLTPVLHTLADRTAQHRRLYFGLLTGNVCAYLGLIAFARNPVLLGGMILIRDSSDTPAAALLSQLTITWLEKRQRQIFGQLRAWGSLGWAVTAMISGWFYAIGGYALLFGLTAIGNLALLPLVRVLPPRTAEPREKEAANPSRPVGLYILLASVFLFYVGTYAFNAFSAIYFKQDLGASNEVIGILSSASALSEIPAMMLIDRLLRRADIRVTLIAGMLGLGTLWFAFSQLIGTSLLIPLMMVRGTFFTLQMISITLLVSRISHPANVATNQALLQVTVPGLAVLLTGSLSGWLFEHVGGRTLFQLGAVMAALSVCLLVVARRQLSGRADQAAAL
jgi:MFS transporter, PPP family, 3-phenylpropionic acid transporter